MKIRSNFCLVNIEDFISLSYNCFYYGRDVGLSTNEISQRKLNTPLTT